MNNNISQMVMKFDLLQKESFPGTSRLIRSLVFYSTVKFLKLWATKSRRTHRSKCFYNFYRTISTNDRDYFVRFSVTRITDKVTMTMTDWTLRLPETLYTVSCQYSTVVRVQAMKGVCQTTVYTYNCLYTTQQAHTLLYTESICRAVFSSIKRHYLFNVKERCCWLQICPSAFQIY